jgi:hypothetical protein
VPSIPVNDFIVLINVRPKYYFILIILTRDEEMAMRAVSVLWKCSEEAGVTSAMPTLYSQHFE